MIRPGPPPATPGGSLEIKSAPVYRRRNEVLVALLAVASLLWGASAYASPRSSRRSTTRLKGGFGHPTDQAMVKGKARGTLTMASAAPVIAPVPPASCIVRDPEDGSCHASADAADVAWLAKGPVNPNDVPAGVQVAGVQVAALTDPPSSEEELVDLEEEEEAEDGGAMAPIDARPGHVPQLGMAEKPSFWRSLANKFNGAVRRSDSHLVSLPEPEIASLFAASFPLPIEEFSAAKFRDSFLAKRGRHRRHHAIDLPALRGTPVVAVVDGVVERLGRDKRGGKVCYLRDLTGRYTFYYAHLSQHEKGLRVGQKVKKGTRLGFVGATGHASGPHLHFAIFRDEEQRSLARALAVNPYLIFASLLK